MKRSDRARHHCERRLQIRAFDALVTHSPWLRQLDEIRNYSREKQLERWFRWLSRVTQDRIYLRQLEAEAALSHRDLLLKRSLRRWHLKSRIQQEITGHLETASRYYRIQKQKQGIVDWKTFCRKLQRRTLCRRIARDFRRRMLLSSMLQNWSQRVHEAQQSDRAQDHYEFTLQCAYFHYWESFMEQRAQSKTRMYLAEKYFKDTGCNRAVWVWKLRCDALLRKKADYFCLTEHLKKQKLARSFRAFGRLTAATIHFRAVLLKRTFENLNYTIRERIKLKERVMQVITKSQWVIAKTCVSKWKEFVYHAHQYKIGQAYCLQNYIARWTSNVVILRVENHLAAQSYHHFMDKRMWKYIERWRRQAKSIQKSKQVLSKAIQHRKRTMIATWHRRSVDWKIKRQLNSSAVGFHTSAAVHHWKKYTERHQELQKQRVLADEWYTGVLQSRSMMLWLAFTESQIQSAKKTYLAYDWSDHRLKTKVFRSWTAIASKLVTIRIKTEASVQVHQSQQCLHALHRWRERTLMLQLQHDRENTARGFYMMNLTGIYFTFWIESIQKKMLRKTRHEMLQTKYRNDFIKRSLKNWVDYCKTRFNVRLEQDIAINYWVHVEHQRGLMALLLHKHRKQRLRKQLAAVDYSQRLKRMRKSWNILARYVVQRNIIRMKRQRAIQHSNRKIYHLAVVIWRLELSRGRAHRAFERRMKRVCSLKYWRIWQCYLAIARKTRTQWQRATLHFYYVFIRRVFVEFRKRGREFRRKRLNNIFVAEFQQQRVFKKLKQYTLGRMKKRMVMLRYKRKLARSVFSRWSELVFQEIMAKLHLALAFRRHLHLARYFRCWAGQTQRFRRLRTFLTEAIQNWRHNQASKMFRTWKRYLKDRQARYQHYLKMDQYYFHQQLQRWVKHYHRYRLDEQKVTGLRTKHAKQQQKWCFRRWKYVVSAKQQKIYLNALSRQHFELSCKYLRFQKLVSFVKAKRQRQCKAAAVQKHMNTLQLVQSLSRWRKNLCRSAANRQLWTEADAQWRYLVSVAAIRAWKKHRTAKHKHRMAESLFLNSILKKSWMQWVLHVENGRSFRFIASGYDLSLQRECYQSWRKRLAQRQEVSYQLSRSELHFQTHLKRQSFQGLKSNCRNRLIKRENYERGRLHSIVQLKQLAMARWRHSIDLALEFQEKSTIALEFHHTTHLSLAFTAFRQGLTTQMVHQEQKQVASECYRRHLRRFAFETWSDVRKFKILEIQAKEYWKMRIRVKCLHQLRNYVSIRHALYLEVERAEDRHWRAIQAMTLTHWRLFVYYRVRKRYTQQQVDRLKKNHVYIRVLNRFRQHQSHRIEICIEICEKWRKWSQLAIQKRFIQWKRTCQREKQIQQVYLSSFCRLERRCLEKWRHFLIFREKKRKAMDFHQKQTKHKVIVYWEEKSTMEWLKNELNIISRHHSNQQCLKRMLRAWWNNINEQRSI